MGAPKALVALGGAPLIARPLAAARAAGLEAVVVAKPDSPLPPLDVPVWHEPAEPVHPLCGLVAALERAGRPLVAVACDQPFVTAELIAALAAADGDVVCEAGGLQPFPGRYQPAALDALRAGLAASAPLRVTVAALSPQRLEVNARVVASVNDPEALAEAERWIA